MLLFAHYLPLFFSLSLPDCTFTALSASLPSVCGRLQWGEMKQVPSTNDNPSKSSRLRNKT